MPAYPFLLEQDLDISNTEAKIRAMQTLGVPYEKGYDKLAVADLVAQSNEIVKELKNDSIRISPKKEIIALIAYMQRMGTDIAKPLTSQNK